jgi:DNA-binding transcriptional LysR family regulator
MAPMLKALEKDIFAVYSERNARSPRVRAFTDFLIASFGNAVERIGV